MLGLVISDMLYRAFPKANEGELSRRLADLVRKETCAEVARAMDLGPALKLGNSESHAGGRLRTTILADACEALVGAVFTDGGYQAADELIARFWKERMLKPLRPLRDPKTMLQEWAQARGLPTPAYRELARTGPHHDPEFRVAVVLPDRPPAEGMGSSKRAAEQAAAAAMLTRVGVSADKLDGDVKPEGDTRCGFVALIGAPNAGKSTLLNALVGSKVTIVSHKVQTTRALIRGITLAGKSQLIFVDTPGIFAPKRRLDRAMVTTAWSGAHEADLVGVLIDARKGIDDEAEALLARLADVKPAKILILNKIDLVPRDTLLLLTKIANEKAKFDSTFMISALTGDGVADLKAWLAERMPPSPWLYPPDQMSDAPMRQLAAEITREKLFERLHQELPYHSTVETEPWKELRGGDIRIEQTIYVERESQRKIVIGKGGQTLKSIGESSRREIAEIVEAKVAPVPVRQGARGLGRAPF